jgi:hypothetical protein
MPAISETIEPKLLTEDEFDEQFKPEDCPESGWKQRDFPEDAEMIETARLEQRLWTMVETDNDGMALLSGMHVVNQIYHIITEKPWDCDYTVEIL